MPDEVLDNLKWTGDCWKAAATIPYFAGTGSELFNPLRDEILRPWGGFRSNAEADAQRCRDESDDEYNALFREAKFQVRFDVGDRKRAISKAQRQAWEKVAARGDLIWNEAMTKALAEYQLQRPIRVRWWKEIYGDLPYERELPEINDLDTLKTMCRPYVLRVHPARENAPFSYIGVHFVCTWIREGFGVLVRDGHVWDITPAKTAHLGESPRSIDHPTLGRLSFINGECWMGQISCDPMLDCQNIAEQRAKFQRDGVNRDRPESLMWWESARGQFGLYIYAKNESEPEAAQVEALLAFGRDANTNVATIIDALFRLYREKHEAFCLEYNRTSIDQALPRLESAKGLKHIVELRSVYVHPADDEGKVRLVFEIHCTFGNSQMLLWRDTEVERFGRWADRKPAKSK